MRDTTTSDDVARGHRMLAEAGFDITPEGRANARALLDAADREWTPERRQELRERLGLAGRAA